MEICAKKDPMDQLEFYINQLDGRQTVSHICNRLQNLGYMDAPASSSHHGAFSGGLLKHSLKVTKVLIDLTNKNNLRWCNEVSPIVIGLFHDLCKCDNYVSNGSYYNENGICVEKFSYSKNKVLDGHGEKSVMVASTLMRLTEEEMFCIRYHMYMFEKGIDPSIINRVVTKYPNVLFTHVADMLAATQYV